MADINELTEQYLVRPGDDPDQPLPAQFDDSKITPLVDGLEYFAALEAALNNVGNGATPAENAGQYILVHGWWLALAGGRYEKGTDPGSAAGFEIVDDEFFYLDGEPRSSTVGGQKVLLDILRQKARAGVDVRVMGWLVTGITSNILSQMGGAKAFGHVNSMTLKSIVALRGEPQIGMKAIVNDISHPAGTGHSKLVVVGTPTEAIGFTGGIDFVNGRGSEHFHQSPLDTWHDLAVQVEGKAVRGLHDWFRLMWEEARVREPQIYRINNLDVPGNGGTATPELLPFEVPATAAVGNHRVQNLRTVPTFNFDLFNFGPSPDPITPFPDGLFEFKSGLKKAISGARSYIYLEDQGIWSVEVMALLHDAIVANPGLRVIIANGGVDPNDPVFPSGYIARAINVGLLRGGDEEHPELTAAQKAQVGFFGRFRDLHMVTTTVESIEPVGENFFVRLNALSEDDFAGGGLVAKRVQLRQGSNVFTVIANPPIELAGPLEFTVAPDRYDPGAVVSPTLGPCEVFRLGNITMHAKVAVIDDAVALVGSANVLMRQSLYTTMEHSVSFVSAADPVVRTIRCRLWADHFHLTNPDDLIDIEQSLHVWNPGWGVASTLPPRRPPYIVQRDIPFSAVPLTGNQERTYDWYHDVDSREDWGGICPPIPEGALSS